MPPPILIFVLTMLIVLAKSLDFLLGKSGRLRLKNAIVFGSWYRLQSMSFPTIANESAVRYQRYATAVLGRAPNHGLLPVFLVFVAILACANYFIIYLRFRHLLLEPQEWLFQGWAAVLVAYLPLLVLLELARQAVASIAARPQILYTIGILVGNLIVAVFYALLVWFATYTAGWWRLLQLPYTLAGEHLVLPTIAPPLMLASLSPTVTFVGIALYLVLLMIAERGRRVAAFVLERCDEAIDSPATIVAGISSALILLLTAAMKVVSAAA